MRNLTVYTLLCFALAAAAFAAPPAPPTLPLPLPAATADVGSGCSSAALPIWMTQTSTPAPQTPALGELPELLPKPEPRTATCDPVRCSKLHGVCECDQLGNCFCVPV
jgi:hypothetical protein